MNLAEFNDASEYYQQVENYLLKDEAAHCLLIGVSKSLGNLAKNNNDFPYLITVKNQGTILATAIQTSRHQRLIISKCVAIKAIRSIAHKIALQNRSLPGVVGLKSEATDFARKWQFLTGQNFKLSHAMGLHQLQVVKPVPKVSGNLRLATSSDRNLLIDWRIAFEIEALGGNQANSNYQLWFDRHLKQKSLFVWQDRVTVSMVVLGATTPNGVIINTVYTTPKYRGKGYATSCVASVTEQSLRQGYKYCFLFTDLANKNSNYIYRGIGYQPVGEIYNYAFIP